MARKLFNFCVVLALAAGCLSGALAAAACPHLGCDTPDAAAQANPHAHAVGGAHDGAGHTNHGAEHSAEPSARERTGSGAARSGACATRPREENCTHCLGRDPGPSSERFGWQPDPFKYGAKLAPPPAAGRVTVARPATAPEITPAQHAPPGSSDRHLLLSVFRI